MRIIDNTGRSKGPYISIVEAEYIDGYRLLLMFDDGTSRLVDFGEYLRHARHPDIRKYLDLDNFKKFKVVYGDIEWPNLDIVFPIMQLYQGKIQFTPGHGVFAKTAQAALESTRPENREAIPLPTPTLRRLKTRAKKEDVPLDLLVQRYLEEAMKRHEGTQRSRS
jgi:hypothetical protein